MADSSTLPGLRSWPQMPPEWWRFFRELAEQPAASTTVDMTGFLPNTTGLEGTISIQSIGTLASGFVGLQLINDASAPGNTYSYGTGPTGTKGWHPISAALAQGANVTLTVGSDGVTTIASSSPAQIYQRIDAAGDIRIAADGSLRITS